MYKPSSMPAATSRTKAQPTPPARGRPPTLSEGRIVEVALDLLHANPREPLSMARIARELSVSPPALTRYFPSREALLTAMSAVVFADFPDELKGATWREQLAEWQANIVRLYRKHPGVLHLMEWDGKLAGPWFRAQMPVIVLLHRLGFRQTRLLETAGWFLAGTVGMVRTYWGSERVAGGRSDLLDLTEGMAHLNPEQRALAEDAHHWLDKLDPERLLRLGLDALIDGVERDLPEG